MSRFQTHPSEMCEFKYVSKKHLDVMEEKNTTPGWRLLPQFLVKNDKQRQSNLQQQKVIIHIYQFSRPLHTQTIISSFLQVNTLRTFPGQKYTICHSLFPANINSWHISRSMPLQFLHIQPFGSCKYEQSQEQGGHLDLGP